MNFLQIITSMEILILGLFAVADAFKLEPLDYHKRTTLIAGGRNATIEEFPYLVALEYCDSVLNCGGSILTPYYILTAAHCLDKTYPPKLYQVRAGSSLREKGGTVHWVLNYTIHEKFGINWIGIAYNDLAILRLETPIAFDNTKQPIAMFESGEESSPGSNASTAGWGKLMRNGTQPEQLKSLKYNIVDKVPCMKSYDVFGGIYAGEICAAPSSAEEKLQSICLGDSGGPLVIDGKLAGIVSFIVGCKSHPYPNVFTEVAHFRKWIDSKMPEINEV